MSERPFTLLIAALGGEGGGVLTDWIVSAAEHLGLPVQSTSIPGVAQRTGATTYYIEIFPVRYSELGGRRPVLALSPGVGDVDVVIASELLANKGLSDTTYAAAEKAMGLEDLVALVAVTGNFSMTCMTANAFSVDPPAENPTPLAV